MRFSRSRAHAYSSEMGGFLDTAWRGLGERPDALELVHRPEHGIPLSSTLPVGDLVRDAVAAASLSASLFAARSAGAAVGQVQLDAHRIATAVTSERYFRLDGAQPDVWAALSGFWRTSDGWVRTHANYPHHRARLLSALGLADDTDADALRSHLANRSAEEVDALVAAAGGVASVVRSEADWRAHAQRGAVAETPFIGVRRIGEAPPATPGPIRVFDLTRVIAGPVATRTLALWGFDVLRIDSPAHPEIPFQHLDTGNGKRSALLDLGVDGDQFAKLLASADVVVTGYRAGALDRFGLSPSALAERRPGIVLARLSAWGTEGPLADRRGFDSIVQAATGIAWLESADGEAPGALPAQALDHSAGYLLAAGITSALRRRLDEGGSWLVETSLARVAQELLDGPRAPRTEPPAFEPTVLTRSTAAGEVTSTLPAPHYLGGPDDWADPPVPWGSSAAAWK